MAMAAPPARCTSIAGSFQSISSSLSPLTWKWCNGLAIPAKSAGIRLQWRCSAAGIETPIRKRYQPPVVEEIPFTLTELEPTEPQDFNLATVTCVQDVADGARCITLDAECSRELVPLDKAYTIPGQFAQVKIGDGNVIKIPVSSPPFPKEVNDAVIYKARGDVPAGTTKIANYSLSVKAPLDLHVLKEDSDEIFNLKGGDQVYLGPFDLSGMDMRPVMVVKLTTLLFFATGRGISTARSIIEAHDANYGSLNLKLRSDVRLYYSAPKPSKLAFRKTFGDWAQKKVKLRVTVDATEGEPWDGHVGSLSDLWDADDIEYDPETTAVVVCAEASDQKELQKLLDDSGIPEEQVVSWKRVDSLLVQ